MDFSISLDGAGKGDVEPLAGESIYDRERGNDNRHHIVFRARAERSHSA